jgi:energy-coupling factor transporter ATP-binding protein EcfA2
MEIMEKEGLTEPIVEADQRRAAEFQALLNRSGGVTPVYLKTAPDFGDEYFAHFFGGEAGEVPAKELPVAFPMKVRRKEMTVVTGDNGSGKSTFLNYVALKLAEQGEKVFIASLEMPVPVLLWLLASQILGSKHLPDSQGRIGIPEDDLAQQANASARFAQSTTDWDYHLMMVIDENKGEGAGKSRIRGSKKWADDANNILRVERNQTKGEKADKVRWELQRERMRKAPDAEVVRECEAKPEGMKQEWDTALTLAKQRHPGTRQNARKYFWFDRGSFQFRERWEEPAVDRLERWKKEKSEKKTEKACGEQAKYD